MTCGSERRSARIHIARAAPELRRYGARTRAKIRDGVELHSAPEATVAVPPDQMRRPARRE